MLSLLLYSSGQPEPDQGGSDRRFSREDQQNIVFIINHPFLSEIAEHQGGLDEKAIGSSGFGNNRFRRMHSGHARGPHESDGRHEKTRQSQIDGGV